MITAMCAGTAPCSRRRWRSSSAPGTSASLIASDFHDLRFLRGDQPVDLLDVVVGELLHVLLAAGALVLGHLLELLDPAHRVGARVAHGDPPFLAELVHHLHQLLAPLLG